MEKIFGDKKITIKELGNQDLRNEKAFLNFVNSLIEEDAKILINRKSTLKEEKDFLKTKIKH